MKRIFSTMMALGLAATLAACGGDDAKKDDAADKKDDKAAEQPADKKEDSKEGQDLSDDDKKALDSFEKQTSDDTLVIGTSEMSGDFYPGWSNNSYDVKVRKLIGIYGNNSYDTLVQDEAGKWQFNSACLEKEPETAKNADGSETTTFTLKKDLKWSDGSPVTSDNYLFSSLFHSYPSY